MLLLRILVLVQLDVVAGCSGEESGEEGGQNVLDLCWGPGCYFVFWVVDSVVGCELTNLVLLSWLSFHTSSGVAQSMSKIALARDVTLGSLPHVHSMSRGCFVIAIEERMCYRV